jgi:hypothetical protein
MDWIGPLISTEKWNSWASMAGPNTCVLEVWTALLEVYPVVGRIMALVDYAIRQASDHPTDDSLAKTVQCLKKLLSAECFKHFLDKDPLFIDSLTALSRGSSSSPLVAFLAQCWELGSGDNELNSLFVGKLKRACLEWIDQDSQLESGTLFRTLACRILASAFQIRYMIYS